MSIASPAPADGPDKTILILWFGQKNNDLASAQYGNVLEADSAFRGLIAWFDWIVCRAGWPRLLFDS